MASYVQDKHGSSIGRNAQLDGISTSKVQLGPATNRVRSASQNRYRARSNTNPDSLLAEGLETTRTAKGRDSIKEYAQKTGRSANAVWRIINKSKRHDDTESAVDQDTSNTKTNRSKFRGVTAILSPRNKSRTANHKDSTTSTDSFRDISEPSDITHEHHATFEKDRLRFSGLPEGWRTQGALAQFGVSISVIQPKTHVDRYTARIPAVLVTLRKELIKCNGLKIEGIFRISANSDIQSSYRDQLNCGSFRGCSGDAVEDGIAMAALIKEWFRMLPETLLSPLTRSELFQAAQAKDGDELCNIIEKLPEPNQSTLFWLLDLLADTALFNESNKMSVKALAIVLAPNLFNAPDSATPMELVTVTDSAVKLVTKALDYRIAIRH